MKIGFGIAALGGLILTGCTADYAKQNDSNVLLLLVSLSANAGAGPDKGTNSAFLISDVSTNGSVVNDNGSATFAVRPKNPSPGGTPVTPNAEDVVLEQYSVSYTRTDGHNVEGVDVPYSFSSSLPSTLIAVGTSSTSVGFIIVRHSAKSEPPLSRLVGFGSDAILSMNINLTFYGHTVSGQAVSVAGSIPVTFADFVDTTSS